MLCVPCLFPHQKQLPIKVYSNGQAPGSSRSPPNMCVFLSMIGQLQQLSHCVQMCLRANVFLLCKAGSYYILNIFCAFHEILECIYSRGTTLLLYCSVDTFSEHPKQTSYIFLINLRHNLLFNNLSYMCLAPFYFFFSLQLAMPMFPPQASTTIQLRSLDETVVHFSPLPFQNPELLKLWW